MLLNHHTLYKLLSKRLLMNIFKKITKKSQRIFLRGGDIISSYPQVFGIYEEVLTKYLNNLSLNGFSDFFIDIGANIGLSSCQNGKNFKKIFCFEPNPLCVNILKTNLAISFDDTKYEIFDFGLGDVDGNFDLYIPKHNWGGAFIRDNNDYTEEILGKKDGFDYINKKNYFLRNISVKNSEVVFSNLFSQLILKNLLNGVVKIDVEGYEKKIMLAILKSLPADINLTIVFENWNPEFNFVEIQKNFKNRKIKFYKFERSIVGTNKSKFRKYFEFLIFGEKTKLVSFDINKPVVGNVVLCIGK
jgi:FkbM family methyltransferase